MKKRNVLRKVLSLSLAALMCVSIPMTVLAETVTDSDSETSVADGLTTTVTTNTTVTTEDGMPTVTVEIVETEINGTNGDGVTVTYDETVTTTTTVDENGNTIAYEEVIDGTEKKEWTEEDSGDAAGQPEVEVELIPGETTSASESSSTTSTTTTNDGEYTTTTTTTTTTTDRTVTADTSEEKVVVEKAEASLEGLQSELKFDRNSEVDQKQQSKDRDLYADNGHFKDPSSVTVTDAPDDYPFQYVGHGDYSGHYVSHIRVIYARDEAGNALKDENGEYIIKELQHANGTTLTKNGVPTTDLEGPYDQTTGTRPQQFLLMNEEGDSVYAYCIDLQTGAESGKYYQVANLEDNDYYASEESEHHVRNIVTNGYWGTSEGTGSLAKNKEDLKAAVAAGLVDKEYDITFTIRGAKYTGQELKEGEYVGNGYICTHVTEHIVLTDEVIDSFTEGEALDATQSAIWSFANGSKLALDGTDRMIVGDITYASSALGDSRNGQNDFAGAARTLAFYNYLVNLDEDLSSTVIINDKNNVEDMSLTVGDKVAGHEKNQDADSNNDVYNVEMNFTLAFVPDPNSDDLLVHITYMQNGEEVTVIKRLAGENTEGREHETITPDENGVYTLSGLQLSENEKLTFDLRLEGTQYLEQGVYIYTAQGGIGQSQTFVGMAEGTTSVDVSKSMTISFDVDENNKVVAEREWHSEYDPQNDVPQETTAPTEPVPTETTPTEPDPTYPVMLLNDDGEVIEEEPVPLAEGPESEDELTEIPDEEVPLADVPETGDISLVWAAMSLFSAGGVVLLNKKPSKKER